MKKYHLGLLLLLTLSGPAFGQQKFPDLASCLRFAFKNRPDLQNERLAETVAENQQKLATAPLYPQLKAVSTYDDYLSLPVQLIPAELLGGQPGEFRRVQFGTQYNFSYGAEASVPLISTQAWFNRSIAKTQTQLAKHQKLNNFQAAAEQIARTYYLVLLTRQATALSQENVLLNDTLLQTAGQKFKFGILEPLEFNRLKALELESKQTWLDNQQAYRHNLLQLKQLLGLPPDAAVELTETLNSAGQQPLTLQVNPEETNQYLATLWRARIAEREWQKQKARWAPEISAYGRYTRQSLSNNPNVFDSALPWFEIAVVGVRLDWPLFTGFHRSASIKQASLNRQIAANNLEQQKLKTSQDFAELTLEYQHAAGKLENYTRHFALYQDNYNLALFKYRNDVFSTDQVLQVHSEKLRSQNQYIFALGNYYISRSLIQLKNEFNQPENLLPYDPK